MAEVEVLRRLLAQARSWFSPHANVVGGVWVEASPKKVLIWMNETDRILKEPSWTPNSSTEASSEGSPLTSLATKQFFPANLAKKYPEFAQQWPELFLPE